MTCLKLRADNCLFCCGTDEVWLVGMGLWVPVQVINFRWVPVRHQTTFVTLVATAWKVFLSIIFHREEAPIETQLADTGERDSLHSTNASTPPHPANTPTTFSEEPIYQLVRDQQVEIERLRAQAEEAVRLRAEIEKLRAAALSS